jgi:hypothetical protein
MLDKVTLLKKAISKLKTIMRKILPGIINLIAVFFVIYRRALAEFEK